LSKEHIQGAARDAHSNLQRAKLNGMSDCYDLRALIVGFGSSGRLAGAYGTVSTAMRCA
jgi:hypothetical protein